MSLMLGEIALSFETGMACIIFFFFIKNPPPPNLSSLPPPAPLPISPADEIRARDITVGPSGKELPPGRGSAKEGAEIFEKRCAHCHGVNGESTNSQFPALSGP